MLSRVFVLGLAAVLVFVASPCQAGIDGNTPDVTYWPAANPTSDLTGVPTLTNQILGVKARVESVHSDPQYPAPDPDPADYLVDSHTNVSFKHEAGNITTGTGIISLDQFDKNRILPIQAGGNGVDPVGQLRGVLLYVSVRLTGGRLVLDNESANAITAATLQIGADLRVYNTAMGIDFSASPYKEAKNTTTDNIPDITKDIGTNAYDGVRPNPRLPNSELDKYCVGTDKFAAIIKPNGPDDPNFFFEYAPIYTDLTDPAKLALFTGTDTIDLIYSSKPYAHAYFSPGYSAIVWPSVVTFDIEVRLVYLYADAVPEPASMSLLGAALVPILLRRFRGRKSRR